MQAPSSGPVECSPGVVGLLLMDAIVAYRMLVLQCVVTHSHSNAASTVSQRVHGRRIRRVVRV